MSKFMAEDLRFIRKFVVIEFCIVAAVIICGGFVYGAESGRWGQTFIYSGWFLFSAAIVVGMLYQRTVQRCKVFNR
jgi:hypothetical protein